MIATERCDGIEIAPYQWSHRLSHMWYYGWDVASGCIWRPKGVTLSLVSKLELDEPQEDT